MSESPLPSATDPEIAALLDFEPVPRMRSQKNGWTAEKQREFIARLAVHGRIGTACDELGKDRGGVQKLYNSPHGASFRAAWHNAIELAERRRDEAAPEGPAPREKPPAIDGRRKAAPSPRPSPARGEGASGQVLNEEGEWEDEASYRERGDEALDRISRKLRMARRLFLRDIAGDAAKRAAFEILTGFNIDWAKAERGEAQIDEPWRKPNMRQPDMLLTAENGWMGEFLHGPDRKAELLQEINAWRAKRGKGPVTWAGEER